MAYRPVKAKEAEDIPTTVSKKRKNTEPVVAEPAAGAGAALLIPLPPPLVEVGENEDGGDDDDAEDDDDADDDGEGCTQDGDLLLQRDMDKRVAALAEQDKLHKQYVLYPQQTTRDGWLRGTNVFESSTVATARLDKEGQPIRTGKSRRASRSSATRCVTRSVVLLNVTVTNR